ncbi:MAG: hypothetical protein V3V14_01855 [Saprospiraceae bacterium]
MDKQLRDKIIELFEYRELPKLISYSQDNWDTNFYELLIQLQYDIYLLDHELETNWDVDMSIITKRWQAIHKDLDNLGISRDKQDWYCRHIYKYQKHELEIRKGKLPTRLTMEYFYFYKSCDVKLLRRIIYDKNPSLKHMISEAEWRLFDLVTEVNDDVVDLQEDATTINGNRFLLSMLEHGTQKTVEVFNSFLQEISDRNKLLKISSFDDIFIQEWTEEQVISTQQLVVYQAAAFHKLDMSIYKQLDLKKTSNII